MNQVMGAAAYHGITPGEMALTDCLYIDSLLDHVIANADRGRELPIDQYIRLVHTVHANI